jgi:hypothetical protein
MTVNGMGNPIPSGIKGLTVYSWSSKFSRDNSGAAVFKLKFELVGTEGKKE